MNNNIVCIAGFFFAVLIGIIVWCIIKDDL